MEIDTCPHNMSKVGSHTHSVRTVAASGFNILTTDPFTLETTFYDLVYFSRRPPPLRETRERGGRTEAETLKWLQLSKLQREAALSADYRLMLTSV